MIIIIIIRDDDLNAINAVGWGYAKSDQSRGSTFLICSIRYTPETRFNHFPATNENIYNVF